MTDKRTIRRVGPDDVWLSEKGVWRGANIRGDRMGSWKHTATMSCPLCGMSASLSSHRIEDNGDVVPSVGCPGGDCKFHEWVTLEGWEVKEVIDAGSSAKEIGIVESSGSGDGSSIESEEEKRGEGGGA